MAQKQKQNTKSAVVEVGDAHVEIGIAAEFIGQYLVDRVTESALFQFKKSLGACMHTKYAHSWDYSLPIKGNAFRAVNIVDSRLDSLLLHALASAEIEVTGDLFPASLVVWVDPLSVSYRIGDYGYAKYIYEYQTADITSLSNFETKETTRVADSFKESVHAIALMAC